MVILFAGDASMGEIMAIDSSSYASHFPPTPKDTRLSAAPRYTRLTLPMSVPKHYPRMLVDRSAAQPAPDDCTTCPSGRTLFLFCCKKTNARGSRSFEVVLQSPHLAKPSSVSSTSRSFLKRAHQQLHVGSPNSGFYYGRLSGRLDPYANARRRDRSREPGTAASASVPQPRRQSTHSQSDLQIHSIPHDQQYVALSAQHNLISSTSSPPIDPTWSASVNPINYDMLHTAPQQWSSYMDSAFSQPTGYMSSTHSYHHHNPYTTTWQPQQSSYNGSTGSTSALYPTQIMSVGSMPPPSLPQEHETRYLSRPMTESSPSTTSSASISSVVAGWTPMHSVQEPTTELPHVCPVRGCNRAYKRKAELDRHTQEKHGPTSGRLLCPVKMCPRGIPGEGFDRMSHLTQHLRSGKHKMTASQAKFAAREHNPRKGGKNA